MFFAYYNKNKYLIITPYNTEEAYRIAYSVLSGNIDKAFSYKNNINNNTYIVVVKNDDYNELTRDICVLKKVGNTFMKYWENNYIGYLSDVKVVDINNDGVGEVYFLIEYSGTAGGGKTISFFFTELNQCYQVEEYHYWGNSSGPINPNITFNPNNNEKVIDYIIGYIEDNDLLHFEKVSFEDPKYAVQKWHHDNGTIKEGMINITYYDGKPLYKGVITKSFETDNYEFVAYHKGPLFCYIKDANEHFVVYSPRNMYNWITDIKYGHGFIFFKLNLDNCWYLFSQKDKDTAYLKPCTVNYVDAHTL